MKSFRGGGTSVPVRRSFAWLVALLFITPLAAFAIHRLSSGTECGWSYSAVGGACRAIILLSIVAGIAVGVLVALATRAWRAERMQRAGVFASCALVVAVLGTLGANQFQDYRRAGMFEMDDETCAFATEKLPVCTEEVWGAEAGAMVRRAQRDCWTDDASYAVYQRCRRITDCKQLIDCVAREP